MKVTDKDTFKCILKIKDTRQCLQASDIFSSLGLPATRAKPIYSASVSSLYFFIFSVSTSR